MIYSYNVKVGSEVVEFSFNADDMDSKPYGISASGHQDSVRTLSMMAYESDSVNEFEWKLEHSRSCELMEEEAPAKPSYSSGMGWGSSVDEEEE